MYNYLGMKLKYLMTIIQKNEMSNISVSKFQNPITLHKSLLRGLNINLHGNPAHSRFHNPTYLHLAPIYKLKE